MTRNYVVVGNSEMLNCTYATAKLIHPAIVDKYLRFMSFRGQPYSLRLYVPHTWTWWQRHKLAFMMMSKFSQQHRTCYVEVVPFGT